MRTFTNRWLLCLEAWLCGEWSVQHHGATKTGSVVTWRISTGYNPPINFGARSLVETYHVVKIRTETWYHSSAFISTTTKQINKPKFGSNSLVFQGRKRKTFCPPINFGARSLVETYHVVKIRTETWYHSSAFISTTTKQINKPKFGSNSLVFQGRKRKTFCRSQWPRNHPQPRHDHQWLFFFLSTTKVRLEK